MTKKFIHFITGYLMLAATQACAPAQQTPDMNTIYTAVAQTFAAATQTAEEGTPVTSGVTSTPTLLPVTTLPTVTQFPSPVPAQTATPILTPGVMQVYVSVPTNCRLGPSVSYERVGGLQVGQVANVVARNATGDYWIIRNPARASETCWLWGRYATVSGNVETLPVYTPPPLPTPIPGFDTSYAGKDHCAGWWVEVRLENTGGITFRSTTFTVQDTVTDDSLTSYTDGFSDSDGCVDLNIEDSLRPGEKLIISSPAFSYDPTGHRLRTRITLCSEANQSGTCLSQSFDFTP